MTTVMNISEELKNKAEILLSERAVMDETFKTLIGEMAKHHVMITEMWGEVRDEIRKRGFKVNDEDTVSFNMVTKEFSYGERTK